MRREIGLNRDWLYRPEFSESWLDTHYEIDSQWESVCLPHSNLELPYNGFDERDSQFLSTYIKDMFLPDFKEGERVILDFQAVMTVAFVWIDGKPAGEHKGGYTPFSIDITPLVHSSGKSRILVRVDSTERSDIPPFGAVLDYLCYGGIYRTVALRIVPDCHMENIKIVPLGAGSYEKSVETEFYIQNSGLEVLTRILSFTLNTGKESFVSLDKEIEIFPGKSGHKIKLNHLTGLEDWSPDHPALYTITALLQKSRGEEVPEDKISRRIGFRDAAFRSDGFYLNGEKIKLRGLNRHQSYPYVGYAMPAREQRQDADRLKNDLGLNLVRTSHYPQSSDFLNRCDEIGLLVFEELPGWQHIGNQEWQDNACSALEEMIRRDWNHPSLILWGVRINESEDHHEFYARTNRLARDLDDSRQTGGVRYIQKSETLEDVYTMNDFIHSGSKKILRNPDKVIRRGSIPYLVTEFNGHMFPTKRFDQEERLREHALRHLRVLNFMMGHPRISGAIGWCAWDYNTHREFGSGDRICYHGVSDMFRIPKMAAAVYSSQISPEKKIVMEPASLFAKGERAAARILPIEVYTNCDSISVYKNNHLIGTYQPDWKNYPHMEHPPVILKDLVGFQAEELPFSSRDKQVFRNMMSYVMIHGEEKLRWHHYLRMGLLMTRYKLKINDIINLFMKYNAGWGEDEDIFEIIGHYKGEEVCRKTFGSGIASLLAVKADYTDLSTGDWDTVRVEYRLEDQYGNIMPYVNEVLTLEIDGPASVIGPSVIALVGGVIAVWLKTTGQAGQIELKGQCSRFNAETVILQVKPADKPGVYNIIEELKEHPGQNGEAEEERTNRS